VSYTAPTFQLKAFHCPLCQVYASIKWGQNYISFPGGTGRPAHVWAALCSHCDHESYWLEDGSMLYPRAVVAPPAHVDTPDHIKVGYQEARQVSGASPRSAAALLRLCIQQICVYLGEAGKNLNDDIGALVKKGMPIEIQQALDIVRVVGNNAVHPGELSADDVAAVATGLFELHNQIVEDRISRPKRLKAMFEKLPQGAKTAIQKRDA
jgi:hypothetical protein